jgi:predicted transcriptional regulator
VRSPLRRAASRKPGRWLQLSVSGTFPHSAISLPHRVAWITIGAAKSRAKPLIETEVVKRMMTKTLRDLLAHAETWPREDQEELAEYAREIEARRTGIYRMSDDERAAVSQGMAEADQGKFVSDDLVAKADKPLLVSV